MSKKILILFVGFLLCIGIIAVPGLTGSYGSDSPLPETASQDGSLEKTLSGTDHSNFPNNQEQNGSPDKTDMPGSLQSLSPQNDGIITPVIKGDHQISEKSIPEMILENAGDGFFAVTDVAPPNHELQIYFPEFAAFTGNHLQMKAECLGDKYISSKVESLYLFRYGTFSFRITPPKGVGLFPAIWMLPEDGAEFPEVDIYEMIGNHPENIYGVMHFMEPGKTETSRDFFKYVIPDTVPDSYTIRFEWTPEHMVWYLDDQPVHTIDHDVPDIPMYMIMNLAVGGDWPGSPDSQTVFPASFDVELLEFCPVEIFIR